MFKLIQFTIKKDNIKPHENNGNKEILATKNITGFLNKLLLKTISTYHPGVYFLILSDIVSHTHDIGDQKERNQLINLCFKIMSKTLETNPK